MVSVELGGLKFNHMMLCGFHLTIIRRREKILASFLAVFTAPQMGEWNHVPNCGK